MGTTAVPIMAKLGSSAFACTPGALGLILIFLMCLWLFFQAKLILINHPHRPSLAKSECAERWS